MDQNNLNSQNMANEPQFGVANDGMTTPVAPMPAPEPATTPMPAPAERKHQWMAVALVVCVILAIGGIGFGIWAMTSNSAEASRLNSEIASLKSQNADLTEKVAQLEANNETSIEAKAWKSTELQNGVFYVLGENGEVVAQSDANTPTVNEVVECESSDDNTVLTCSVETSEGEGWFLYDVYGDSLISSFDEE